MKDFEQAKLCALAALGLSAVFACSTPAEEPGGSGGAGSGSGGSATGAGGSNGGTGTNGGTTSAGAPASGEGGGGGRMSGAGGAMGGKGGAAAGGPGKAGSGAGGSSAGGSSAGGGAGTGSGGAEPGLGCGSSDPLASGRATIDVDGAMREYVLALPDDYDPSHPYKLVFAWHWRGGVANDVVTGSIIGGPYYGLEQRAEGSAIFVAPEGIDNGWANTGGRDITFLKAMLELFDSALCIDHERIFSLGFSYGGMMSDAIGCEMADVFRAIAPMSGAFYSGCQEPNMHPIALWLAHGTTDNVVPIDDGKEALEKFRTRNGCTTMTMPTEPSPCVSFQGCMAGYPVTYCEFNGGHGPQNFAPAAVWNFFNQF
jgi:polyhydroxybutyrate depolymerase